MRKKDLFEQNTVLFNRLKAAEATLEKYKKLYSDNLMEIQSLRRALLEAENKEVENTVNIAEVQPQSGQQEKLNQPEPQEQVIQPEMDEVEADSQPEVVHKIPDTNCQVKLDGIMQYAAEVIGKIVIEATKTGNIFAQNPNEYSKDLLNLVLGKTEVCKSQIFDICSDPSVPDKQSSIDLIKNEALEYFNSLTKQM